MFPALIGNLGTTEVIVILVLALLLFGRRLPEVGRSLGRGIVEFKKGVKGIEDDIRDDMDRSDRDIERIPETQKREGFRAGSSGDAAPAPKPDSTDVDKGSAGAGPAGSHAS